MNKLFPCGHKGKGQYCHRCREEERQADEKRAQKAKVQAVLSSVGIELKGIPTEIAERSVRIIHALHGGVSHLEYGGKRLTHRREVISIPVGLSYRILCIEESTGIRPIEVLSHERYNRRYKELIKGR